MTDSHIWTRQGHRWQRLEWGLWRDVDEKGVYVLCYRSRGRHGPQVRRIMRTGPQLKLSKLREHVRKINSQREALKLGARPRMSAGDALNGYLAELERRNRVKGHVSDVQSCLKRFVAASGMQTIDQARLEAVERFLHGISANDATARTQNKYRSHIGAWLKWAMQRGYVESNPVERIVKAREVRRLKEFPMPKDMIALVDASSGYDAAVWTFLALTGIRRGSFLALTPDCFRDDGIVVRHTKEQSEWVLAFDDGCPLWKPELSELGRRIWRERKPTAAYMRFRFKAACKRIEKAYTLHSLRHAFCSWLTMLGESMQDVAAWAHHASATTTEKWYAHLRPRGQSRAAKNSDAVCNMCAHCLRASLAGVAGPA